MGTESEHLQKMQHRYTIATSNNNSMLYPRGQTKSQARLNQDIYNISAAHQFQNLKGYDEVAAQTEVRNSETGIVPNEIA